MRDMPIVMVAHADTLPLAPSTVFLDSVMPVIPIKTMQSSGNITYSETDLNGTTILKGQALASAGQVLLSLPKEADGYYMLHVVDHTGSPTTTQTIPLAILAPFSNPTSSPFGISAHFGRGDDLSLIPLVSLLGVSMVREDATWSQIEQAPGQYNFSTLDPSMYELQQNNLTPLLILDYTNRLYDNNQTPYDSAGLTAFANYAKAVVSHYGSQLKTVEVYNEYNGIFSTGVCADKASCYAQMLQATYPAIKAVRPDVTVIGGAVFSADLAWFRQLFQQKALRYMDAVSDHPYTTSNFVSPEMEDTKKQMENLKALIKSSNGGTAKPLWITEMGWPTSFLHVDERTQADYLVRAALLSVAAGVDKFFWYDLLNDGTSTFDDEDNFGLLNRPDYSGLYTPKPSYVAYAVLTRQLSGQHFISSNSIGWSIYDEQFSNNTQVLWSAFGTPAVIVSTTTPIAVTSMTGSTQSYTPSHGQIVLTLSGDPIYLHGAVKRITLKNSL